MNKAQLVEKVALELGRTKKEVALIVSAFLDDVKDELKSGTSVKISGFGNFIVKEKEAHTAKNPITKEEILVPACKKVSFKPSDVLKDELSK